MSRFARSLLNRAVSGTDFALKSKQKIRLLSYGKLVNGSCLESQYQVRQILSVNGVQLILQKEHKEYFFEHKNL